MYLFTPGGGSSGYSVQASIMLNFSSGRLLSSTFSTTRSTADFSPDHSLFYEHRDTGNYVSVAVRLADGTVLAPPLPVPEPTTWAMMVAGFGALGIAMRRRQSALRAA